jgi:hypothetical protein
MYRTALQFQLEIRFKGFHISTFEGGAIEESTTGYRGTCLLLRTYLASRMRAFPRDARVASDMSPPRTSIVPMCQAELTYLIRA